MSIGATPLFDSLGRDGFRLYRGSSGRLSRLIMAAAVGPARAAAAHIRDRAHDLIASRDQAEVFRFFSRFLCGRGTVAMPHPNLADNLDMLLRQPRVVTNLYTSFEHVVWEAPINSPFTGRLLESVTTNPKTAVLYAYGIDVEAWHRDRSVTFYRGAPNAGAFLAVLDRGADTPLAIIHATNVYGDNGLTEQEAKRRVQRDGEVLLTGAETPALLIDLPPFDPDDPKGSLEAAAEHLVRNSLAIGAHPRRKTKSAKRPASKAKAVKKTATRKKAGPGKKARKKKPKR